ncbi:MAG: hypothetical protein R2764_09045 [Bacteroidales bacterium]
MKNLIFVFFFTLVYQFAIGQYITPGTGIVWDLENLVENSSGVVSNSGGVYFIHNDLIISETDTIRIITNETIKIEAGKLITVLGVLQVNLHRKFSLPLPTPHKTLRDSGLKNLMHLFLKTVLLSLAEELIIYTLIF